MLLHLGQNVGSLGICFRHGNNPVRPVAEAWAEGLPPAQSPLCRPCSQRRRSLTSRELKKRGFWVCPVESPLRSGTGVAAFSVTG